MFDPAQYLWGFLSAAAVAAVILMTYHAVRPDKKRLLYWIIPALLIICGLAVTFLIETDAEKITCTISKVLKAAAEEKPDEIGKLLAENYSDSGHSTKSKMMAYCKVALCDPVIYKNYKSILSIDISDAKAKVILTVRVVFDEEGIVYEAFGKKIMVVKTEMYLSRQSDGNWLINKIELLKIDARPVGWGQISQALDF